MLSRIPHGYMPRFHIWKLTGMRVGHVKDLRICHGSATDLLRTATVADRFADEKTAQRIGLLTVFTPQPLRAVGVLFSPMVSGWAGWRVGRQQEEVCPACISETIMCRKLILGRDIG